MAWDFGIGVKNKKLTESKSRTKNSIQENKLVYIGETGSVLL